MASLKDIFSKVHEFVDKIGHVIAGTFVAIFGKQQAQDFAKAALGILDTVAGKIVTDIVAAVESANPSASGHQKAADAFNQIKNSFHANGLEAKDSFINLLIEIAVQATKGTLGVITSLGASKPAAAPPAA